MNNVINSFGNEMFWGANQIQTGKLSNTKDYNWYFLLNSPKHAS